MRNKAILAAVLFLLVMLALQGWGMYVEARHQALDHHTAFHLTRWLQLFGTQIVGRLAEGGMIWLLLTATPVKSEADRMRSGAGRR